MAAGVSMPAPGAVFGVVVPGDLSGAAAGGSDLGGEVSGPVCARAGVIASKLAIEIVVRRFLMCLAS